MSSVPFRSVWINKVGDNCLMKYRELESYDKCGEDTKVLSGQSAVGAIGGQWHGNSDK